MSATIKGLKETEREWIEQAIVRAMMLVRSYRIAGDHPKLTPAVLDQTYAAWLAHPLADMEATGVFNALGVAFGQYLVDHAGMRWVVYAKEGQTDIAAYRASGKVVVFPTHVIRKRYPNRSTNFLAPMYSDMVKSLSMAAKPEPKSPWWKFGG